MEVLASMNRMSAITFLSLYFLSKDGTGLQWYHNRSAFVATQEFLITYCLTFVCFILFVVPFKVHFVDISRKLL